MKDKLERAPFSQDTFDDKVQECYLEYMGELQKTTDKKLELFIQVNYFHSCLDNAMEFLLKTDQGRGVKPHQIIRILFEKGILDDVKAKNANKINKIRNLFAHQNNSPHMIRNAAEIINKIEIELSDFPPMAGHSTASVKELMESVMTKWDMYQKLDFLIHDLVTNMKNKVILMKD